MVDLEIWVLGKILQTKGIPVSKGGWKEPTIQSCKPSPHA